VSAPTTTDAAPVSPMRAVADELDALGICAIPVAENGTKRPAVDWKEYQRRQPTDAERADWWADGLRTGMGIVTGEVSGGLEMTELEARAVEAGALETIAELAAASGDLDLLRRLTVGGYVVRSASGGWHVYARLAGAPVPGNTKLAATADHVTLAETRGEGGFAVTAPSGGRVHPTGGRWEALHGSPATIPTITVEERERFHALLRALDERPASPPPSPFQQPRSTGIGGVSPGDDYAERTTWAEILEPAGWHPVFVRNGVTYWRRPGKSHGISATTGHGGDWFYPFTTSTEFDANRTHTKFHVYAVLQHSGDHSAAAKELQARGYGQRVERPTTPAAGSEDVCWQEPETPEFPWDERESLSRVRDFARGRRAGPFAVLGIALARALAVTSPRWVLPPHIGGRGSLNLFVAPVGPSGNGKGAAHAAAADAISFGAWRDPISGEPLRKVKAGSGEGVAKQYARWRRGEKESPGKVVRIREAVLFDVPEIDTLTALQQRQGATLSSTLRELFSGEELGFGYADQEKAITIEAHGYRATMVLGVQPLRARKLFEVDADGGLPQRFLWAPTGDPEAPETPPAAPEPLRVHAPVLPGSGIWDVRVCAEARAEIDAHRLRTLRGEQSDPLDAHRLHLRQKVAAGLAVLDGHLEVDGITADDWRLAGALLAVSDATRESIRSALAEQTSAANRARGRSEGERQVEIEDTVERASIAEAARAALALLRKTGDWMTTKQIRAGLAGRNKPSLVTALEGLVSTGQVQVEEIEHHGQPGHRYRVTA
jgi:Bifunctional DNA primase/polymerase, N-terminal